MEAQHFLLTQRLDADTARHVVHTLAATLVQAAARRMLGRRRAVCARFGKMFVYDQDPRGQARGSGRFMTWEVYMAKFARGEIAL